MKVARLVRRQSRQFGGALSSAGARCRGPKSRLQATVGSDPSQEWSIHRAEWSRDLRARKPAGAARPRRLVERALLLALAAAAAATGMGLSCQAQVPWLTTTYRSARVAVVASAGLDAYETWNGIGSRYFIAAPSGGYWWTASEGGWAAHVVNPHSPVEVVGFEVGQDALVLLGAHWLSRRGRWGKMLAIGLLGSDTIAHLSGARSWIRLGPRRSGEGPLPQAGAAKIGG